MDSAAIAKVKKLLEQSANFDADERTMALLDLVTELQKHSNLDASLQVPCRNTLISRLQDKNGTVKTAAVKWLTESAGKFDSEQIIYISDKLGGMVVEKKQQTKKEEDESAESGSVRDFADGLSNLLAVLTDDNGKVVAPNLAKHLIKGLSYPPSKDTELEMVCLDLLQQLIRRFGHYINGDVESDGKKETNTDKLLKSLQTLLEHPDENVQERTSFTIGPLVLILSEKPFTQMIERVISQIEKSKKPDLYIKTIGAVSQSAGLRVAPYLPKFVPRLIKFCVASDDDMATDDAEKMKRWEICLNALASIIKSCPTSVADYLKNIVQVSLKLMTFDPNFQDDDDGAMDTGGEEVDWGGDGGGDGGDDGWGDEPAKPAAKGKPGDKKKDDDGWDSMAQKGEAITADESWKVRRGAVRVLSIFIQYQSDKLKQYYAEICDQFVKRFKERDVNVKEDILLATCLLLKEGVVIEKQGDRTKGDDDLPVLAIPTLVRTRSTYETLDLKTDDIIKGLNKQFTTPNVETRTKKAIFKVLSELILVKQGELGDHLPTLAPHITSGLEAEGKEDVLNTDAIKLLHLVLEFNNFDQIEPFVKQWTVGLTKLSKKGKRGNVADALHALGSLAKKAAGKKVSPEHIQEWFKITFAELEQKDTQEKVKMASIAAMGIIISNFGDSFTKEVPKVLALFDERLRNETTRKVVLRALTKAAGSETKIDLRPLLAESKDKDKKSPLAEMTTFMRKTDADLKHITAGTIEALIKRNAADFKKEQYDLVLAEVSTHIGDTDLMMASHCLKLVSSTLAYAPGPTAVTVGKDIVPRAIKLVTSPLLQGQALLSLIAFFQQAVISEGKVKELSYGYLQPAVLALVVDALPKDNVQAVARIIAGMTSKVSDDEFNKTVAKFVGDIKGAKTPVHVKYVALLSLGEIGKLRDLSGQSGLEKVVFSAFSDPNVQQAASYALGSISIGNLKFYLPILTGLIKPTEERLYLLLNALNEIIKAQSESQKGISNFAQYMETVTPILEEYLESKNEGVRSVVSESLGRLTVFDPEKFFPKIAALADEKKHSLQRLAAIVALRFSFNEHLRYAILGPYLKKFLVLLKDPDLEVRRQACVTVSSLLHAHADSLPREVLASDVLPSLYSEVKAHPELIEEKDYVAVKITVDHGLPLRKEVYSCLLALFQLVPKRLVMQEFLKNVKEGLVDHTCDIQIAAFEIFKQVALNEPESLLEFLDTLPDLLLKKIKDHLKAAGDQKTGQKERDVLRAFVSACVLFNKIPGVDLCTAYKKFFKQVCATALLKEMLAELSKGTSGE